ncbi:glycerol-3-phosphate dehydrogenase/oxidase [Jiulongibacter sediminis]|uniref:FAD-dependent oxidoreductase n=1 Tax=Jiulongibacter sediminis TaxID=1605367 RepID=A0A0P7C3B7_9BACT|nr:FAD-dependent oxidoreductase [Jiulongibacter sediminis]KPM49128.1 FAD-dependent oxidoreductase [Jiulongibacter sediminis]TBX26184.1 FAD-dependent oxidoreductase [Jiulongibacter sediminis]
MKRPENLDRLRTEEFDICVIGAGASGSGVTLDATLRGFKVALIDRSDFCSETSSRSTKLIHGGVRYLEQAFKKLDFAQLKQVNHGLHERKTLLKLAPHLAKPLALITPVFSWFEGLYYSIGLKIYGLIAGDDGMPKAKWLNKKETFQRIPGLTRSLHSSIMYYDGQFDDSRFTVAMVQSAVKEGAAAANYVELKKFRKNASGKIHKAVVSDLISNQEFSISAKLFVNCTGPYADHVRLMADPAEELRMRPAKGVHIVFPSSYLQSKDAMLIPETKDGRVVFVKPLDDEVMVGTTDTAYHDLANEPVLEEQEVDYLLETLEPFIEKMPQRADIKAGFAGIRPLLAPKSSNRKDTKSLLRDHEVEYDQNSGLISLLGGKWTTYRVMAKDTVDYAAELLRNSVPCQTDSHVLVGAQQKDFNAIEFSKKALETGISEEQVTHLLDKYGDQAEEVLKLFSESKDYSNPIIEGYPFLKAEVVYTLRNEMVTKLRDFLSRRIRLEISDWEGSIKAAERIAPILQKELGWSEEQTLIEVAEYVKLIEGFKEKAGL